MQLCIFNLNLVPWSQKNLQFPTYLTILLPILQHAYLPVKVFSLMEVVTLNIRTSRLQPNYLSTCVSLLMVGGGALEPE